MSKETAKPETETSEVIVHPGFGEVPAVSPVSAGSVPYLAFMEPKSNKAAEVAAAIPGIQAGQPYLGFGLLYQSLVNVPVVIAMVSPFWEVEYDKDFITPVKVNLTKFENSKETVVIAGIALTNDGPISFCSSIRTTKTGPAKVAINVAAASDKPGWADNKVKEGLVKLPGMLRHAGVLSCTPKTGSYGVYQVAKWTPAPLTIEQAVMVSEFAKSPDCESLQTRFAEKCAEYVVE